ncbi:hypothetical protein HK100_005282 [Physocladia obscura]|uniref:Uncharacterized protein n=1 Tax=Physocladia obscura TaxID=109957 RepID=A0AAD5XDC3_9FUNG|nr:hypothetical protein HK100_005282 [Physocladia obscura]
MNLYPAIAEGIRETICVRKIQAGDKKRATDAAAEVERMRLLVEKDQLKASGSLAAFHMRNSSNGGLLRSGGVLSKENLSVSAVVRAISVRSRRASSIAQDISALANDNTANTQSLVESPLNLKRMVLTIRQKTKQQKLDTW